MLPLLTEIEFSVPVSLPVFTRHGQGSELELYLLSTGWSNIVVWFPRKNSTWATHLGVSTGRSAQRVTLTAVTTQEEDKSPVFSHGQKIRGQERILRDCLLNPPPCHKAGSSLIMEILIDT